MLGGDFMKEFFDSDNNGETFGNATDYFIKSQIMHFYFVYIHPYFDINGRTARTTSLWHLLNEKAYPFESPSSNKKYTPVKFSLYGNMIVF